jgi:AcrR family transcriptional regulator
MSEHLTAEQILSAAEEVLRRYGPTKATVVDVARALGVSHGSVYRHFPSKAALRDAVARRWLGRILEPLTQIAETPGPAIARLRAWLDALVAAKHAKVLDDPELFATYDALADEAREVVAEHVAAMVAQVAAILADGVAQGCFEVSNLGLTARAVLDATGRFHRPSHAAEWGDPGIAAAYEAVWALVLNGLKPRG